jgi:hypothetical protein
MSDVTRDDLDAVKTELLAAIALVSLTGQSSVELSLTAQGRVSWTTKVYSPDPRDAADTAQSIHDALALRYPREGK